MTDQTPGLLDITVSSKVPHATLMVQHSHALRLLNILWKSRRLWQGKVAEFGFLYSLENTERVAAEQDLATAGDWARWFAAERDQVRTDLGDELAAIRGWQTPYRNRIDQLEMAYSELRLQLDAAHNQHAALESERDRARTEAGAVEGYVAALQARVMELQAQVTAREARIAEPDSAPSSRCQATMTGALFNEPDRCIWCELPTGHVGNHDAAVAQPGHSDARVSWPEPAAAPSSPHAYVAVKRKYSIHADGPEWHANVHVIPAADPEGDLDHFRSQGYDLLPIVGTDAGTRHAAQPQPDTDDRCPGECLTGADLGASPENGGWMIAHVDPECPVHGQSREPAPVGYVVGWLEDGCVNIALDEAGEPLEGADTLAYTSVSEAEAFLAEIAPEDPDTTFRVYELREARDA